MCAANEGTKGTEAPLATDAPRRREGGKEGEINADCYSRNLMRSHLPGTWPALVCACLRSLLLLSLSKWSRMFRPLVRWVLRILLGTEEPLSCPFPPSFTRSDLPHPFAAKPRISKPELLFASPLAAGDFNVSSLGRLSLRHEIRLMRAIFFFSSFFFFFFPARPLDRRLE